MIKSLAQRAASIVVPAAGRFANSWTQEKSPSDRAQGRVLPTLLRSAHPPRPKPPSRPERFQNEKNSNRNLRSSFAVVVTKEGARDGPQRRLEFKRQTRTTSSETGPGVGNEHGIGGNCHGGKMTAWEIDHLPRGSRSPPAVGVHVDSIPASSIRAILSPQLFPRRIAADARQRLGLDFVCSRSRGKKGPTAASPVIFPHWARLRKVKLGPILSASCCEPALAKSARPDSPFVREANRFIRTPAEFAAPPYRSPRENRGGDQGRRPPLVVGNGRRLPRDAYAFEETPAR